MKLEKLFLLLFGTFFLFGCQTENSVDILPPTATIVAPTDIPDTSTPIPTNTAIPLTFTPEPPTNTPTPSPISCYTPKSLMLHSAFGTSRMRQLADQIIANNLITITYAQLLSDYLSQGICAPDNAIIVSLDDLGTEWLRPVFQDMIQIFLDKGLTLVAGVVTNQPANPAVWEYLREIQAQGIELASHSHGHLNLTLVSAYQLEIEVVQSYQLICDNTASCPVTLILPFGEGANEKGVLDLSNGRYTFIVGILGGLQFADPVPYVLGRIPPNNDDQSITITLLENTFGR